MIYFVKFSFFEVYVVGECFEVYMLDLFEYLGLWLKKDFMVIELKGDILVFWRIGRDGR